MSTELDNQITSIEFPKNLSLSSIKIAGYVVGNIQHQAINTLHS